MNRRTFFGLLPLFAAARKLHSKLTPRKWQKCKFTQYEIVKPIKWTVEWSEGFSVGNHYANGRIIVKE